MGRTSCEANFIPDSPMKLVHQRAKEIKNTVNFSTAQHVTKECLSTLHGFPK